MNTLLKGLDPEKWEKEEKKRKLKEKEEKNITELASLIKSVVDTPKENVIIPNALGKKLIGAMGGGLNKQFDEAVARKTKAVELGELEKEDLIPKQWLERLDTELKTITKRVVPENSEHLDLIFNFAKFFTYKYMDRELRQYLERELFRLKSCEYEVPFYLDDVVSETQEPIQCSECWWVPILGYGGDQKYGCFGFGEAGPNPHPMDYYTCGTQL